MSSKFPSACVPSGCPPSSTSAINPPSLGVTVPNNMSAVLAATSSNSSVVSNLASSSSSSTSSKSHVSSAVRLHFILLAKGCLTHRHQTNQPDPTK
eukprot:scaffold593645_cov15-Prasinocladus_malaysianus.AAC.1